MGIRAVTSQLKVSHDTTVRKTRNQAERMERNLTGKRDHFSEWKEDRSTEMWDGAHGVKREDRAEATIGPFKWNLVNALKEHGFSNLHQPHPENTRDHHCAQTLVKTVHH